MSSVKTRTVTGEPGEPKGSRRVRERGTGKGPRKGTSPASYLTGLDVDFGPFFLKFSSYFPYGAKLCFNGHHWAQRQAQAAGIAFTALDNGFLDCDDPDALQRICDRLSAAKIDAFFRRWLARVPHPFTAADRRAGYRYELSILQAEFSLTQVLDRPHSGRVFFEQLIRENLDLGRPDKASLIFDRRVRLRGRRPTPSRWRTRVLTPEVTPSIHVDYKHSKIKQYHKLQRAIRTQNSEPKPPSTTPGTSASAPG